MRKGKIFIHFAGRSDAYIILAIICHIYPDIRLNPLNAGFNNGFLVIKNLLVF